MIDLVENSKKDILAVYFLTGSVEKTAKTLNYSYSWVYRVLKRAGLISVKKNSVSTALKNLTDEQKQLILADYKKGVSVNDIRKKYNVSTSCLYMLLSRYNLTQRYQRTTLSWDKLPKEVQASYAAETILLFESGVSRQKIAERFNLPLSRIDIILKLIAHSIY